MKKLKQIHSFSPLAPPILPETVVVAFERIRVDVYIPNPLQCYFCLKFGHHENSCRSEKGYCYKCGNEAAYECARQCDDPIKCKNCGEQHHAKSRKCSYWKKEKRTLEIKYKQNISFAEARQIVKEEENKIPPQSFASLFKNIDKQTKNKPIPCETRETQCNLADLPSLQTTIKSASKATEQSNKDTKDDRGTPAAPSRRPPAVHRSPSVGRAALSSPPRGMGGNSSATPRVGEGAGALSSPIPPKRAKAPPENSSKGGASNQTVLSTKNRFEGMETDVPGPPDMTVSKNISPGRPPRL